MHSRIVPIFSENTVILFIEIQLIHSEGNQKILGPALFFIGILIFHSHLPHNPAAAGIVNVMRRCDIGKSVLLYLRYNSPPGFRDNSPMPKLLSLKQMA